MTIFMETTRTNPERTVAEIHDVLRSHGATAILNEHDEVRKKGKEPLARMERE